MSLRSRTLRARMLRLSRRAMRLTIRGGRGQSEGIGSSRLYFAQLIWRRARALRLPRENAAARHLHENHVFIRPDVRVSVHMHLAALRAARSATGVWPQGMRQRRSETPLTTRFSRQLRWTPLIAESRSNRVRIVPQLVDTPGRMASLARRLIARMLMTRPARAAAQASVPHGAGPAQRDAALAIPSMRHTRVRGGPAETRPERQRLSPRDAFLLPRPASGRLIDRETGEARILAFRSRALPAGRLRRAEVATAGPATGNVLTWREAAPIPLHYATPRATAPAVHLEHTAPMPPAPSVKSPTPASGQSARPAPAPVLDRAATDRLADEVIRRIERRVRIERERRGI